MPRGYATGVYVSTPHKWERSLRVYHQQDGGRSQPQALRDCHRGHFDNRNARNRLIFLILRSLDGVAPRLLPYSSSRQVFAHLTSIQTLYLNVHSPPYVRHESLRIDLIAIM
jgi:hypothetical protein